MWTDSKETGPFLEKIGGGIREERKSAKEVNECGGSASDARFPVV